MPRDYWKLSAIEGDPMDNLDGTFAESRTGESPLLNPSLPTGRVIDLKSE